MRMLGNSAEGRERERRRGRPWRLGTKKGGERTKRMHFGHRKLYF
jgi:hypothetical protein